MFIQKDMAQIAASIPAPAIAYPCTPDSQTAAALVKFAKSTSTASNSIFPGASVGGAVAVDEGSSQPVVMEYLR